MENSVGDYGARFIVEDVKRLLAASFFLYK